MYSRTIENLRRLISLHKTPLGRASIGAFSESYGFDKSNLIHTLGGKQEMSVGLFLRLAAALDGKPAPPMPDGVERWSLRTWLQLDSFTVQHAMYTVNFSGQ